MCLIISRIQVFRHFHLHGTVVNVLQLRRSPNRDMTELFSYVYRLVLFTALLLLASRALARDEWCMADHDEMHDDDDHHHSDENDHEHAHDETHADVHPEDFLAELFHAYGTNETCRIEEEG